MIAIRAKIDTADAQRKIARAMAALQPEAIDPVVDQVGLKTLRDVVLATPKRWFGQVRRSWQIEKPAMGARVVKNDNKVMLFLEEGTADKGTGYIYPKVKKALYIPLTRKAAMGWTPGLVFGTDYVLAKRAHGIKPRYIAAKESVKAEAALYDAMVDHLRRALA